MDYLGEFPKEKTAVSVGELGAVADQFGQVPFFCILLSQHIEGTFSAGHSNFFEASKHFNDIFVFEPPQNGPLIEKMGHLSAKSRFNSFEYNFQITSFCE